MIGYIKGKVLSLSNGNVLIENNGIGYEVACSKDCYASLKRGEEGEIFTYLAVREDGAYLYGFISQEEKQMFLKLISVSGIGPKMGIAVVSGMELNDLVVCIAKSDVKGLSKIKGLGKKTAERIILELREKVDENDTLLLKTESKTEKAQNEDAVIALMSLGFTRAECNEAVKKAEESGLTDVSQIISYSLKVIK